MLCRESRRNEPKSWCTSRGITNEPFVFGRVLVARYRHRVSTFISLCVLPLHERYIRIQLSTVSLQIALYRWSSLDGRGNVDSGRSLQAEFILLNISHTTFRHCRERSYPSFGQPFPKQLYRCLTFASR